MDEINKILELLFGENNELRLIIFVTLKMAFFSTVISSLLGFPLGILIGSKEFLGKSLLRRIVSTLMGLPPVIGGLIVYLIFSRSGPLGNLKLLFSIRVMVIAQIVLITPIIAGLSIPIFNDCSQCIKETSKGIGLSGTKQTFMLIFECRKLLVSVILSGFGRSIAEVGAVQLVGGNIQNKTRVMTTAIMLETNKGNFNFAVALGIVLLLISFIINSLAFFLQDSKKK